MAFAKRKLKDPDAPVVKRPPAEIALAAKRIELADHKAAHKLAVAAQIADEKGHALASQRDPGLVVEKRKIEYKLARAEAEAEVLAVTAKVERSKTVEAKSDWASAQRDRALLVIAIRKANREISALREQGMTGPCDFYATPFGYASYEDALLGGQSRAGVTGTVARAYLAEAFNAGFLTRAELTDDD